MSLRSHQSLKLDAFRPLRVCVTGGGPMPAEVQKKFHPRFPHLRLGEKLRAELDAWLKETDDPRLHGDDDRFDKYEYFYPERPGGKLR